MLGMLTRALRRGVAMGLFVMIALLGAGWLMLSA